LFEILIFYIILGCRNSTRSFLLYVSSSSSSYECSIISVTYTHVHGQKSSKSPTNSLAWDLANKSDLTDLINDQQWPSVSMRIKFRPNEVSEWLTVTTRASRVTRLSAIHYACERKPPVDIVEALVKTYPKSLITPSEPGLQLPIHLACTWGANVAVICLLLAADPSSLWVKDEMGNLPLHSACYSGAHLDIIKALMGKYPMGAFVTNFASTTALDIVRRLKHENWNEVEALLMKEMGRLKNMEKKENCITPMVTSVNDVEETHEFQESLVWL